MEFYDSTSYLLTATNLKSIDNITTYEGTITFGTDPSDDSARHILMDVFGISDRLIPEISNVIFNDPATIVFWDDGSKTVVKCQDGDVFSKESGLALAIIKKAYGNSGSYNNIFKKWCS